MGLSKRDYEAVVNAELTSRDEVICQARAGKKAPGNPGTLVERQRA